MNASSKLICTVCSYGAQTVTTDCFGRAYEDRIWAHAFSRSVNSWVSADESMKLNGYTVNSAFDWDCGTVPGKMGLTVHEYMVRKSG